VRALPNGHGLEERTISIDEMTGVQVLERKHPGLPLQPGQVLQCAFEYIRDRTRCWFINDDVVTGQVVVPSWGSTPQGGGWPRPPAAPARQRSAGHKVVHHRGHLNTHQNVSVLLSSIRTYQWLKLGVGTN
jgi:hypothetical protein